MEDFLTRIEQTELENMGRLNSFLSGINIVTTRDFLGSKFIEKATNEKKFKPSIVFKIAVTIFAFAFLILFIWETFFNKNRHTKDVVFSFCFAIIVIIAVIKQFYFDKKLNYIITLNNTGISIDERFFLWKDIYATAIATKGGGKNKTRYLLIAMKDLVTYEMFDLSHFADLNYFGFAATLAAYIEYFKPAID